MEAVNKALRSFDDYCEEIRVSSRNILNYQAHKGYDNQIERLQKSGKFNLACKREIETIQKEKNNAEVILKNDLKLKVYLDFEVRKIIMNILIAVASSPFTHSRDLKNSIGFLESVGFSDVKDYLLEFTSVEDIRKDLFQKAGLEFTSCEELSLILFEAQASHDTGRVKKAELLLEKNGIIAGQYSSDGLGIDEIAMMSSDYAEILVANKEEKSKYII